MQSGIRVTEEKKQSRSQQLVVLLAYASYLAAIVCMFMLYRHPSSGEFDVIDASLIASTIFFTGVGIVLHVIGRTNLPSMRLGAEDDS